MNTTVNRQFDEDERIARLCRHAAILGHKGMDLRYVVILQMHPHETEATHQAVRLAYSEGVAMRHAEEWSRLWARIRNWFRV